MATKMRCDDLLSRCVLVVPQNTALRPGAISDISSTDSSDSDGDDCNDMIDVPVDRPRPVMQSKRPRLASAQSALQPPAKAVEETSTSTQVTTDAS